MSVIMSFGRWFGFYWDSGYFLRFGLGFLEIGFAWADGANTGHYVDDIAKTAGEAQRKLLDDWTSHRAKVPAGTMTLKNGRKAQVRVELESDEDEFLEE